ncbi:hypothetical protein PMAC_002987 [Pneumocystis sp. 'macacae']|nr:hypothetical protein PMAC_002987 [Pneumocystis sp. 'macacae']
MSLLIAKQKLNYQILKTITTKIYMQEESRHSRLKIMILNNEKNELFESEIKYRELAENLTVLYSLELCFQINMKKEKIQALQNHFFLTKQENEELKSKLLEYQKTLYNFQKNTTDIDSISSQNEMLVQKINSLKTELENEKNKLQLLQNNLAEKTAYGKKMRKSDLKNKKKTDQIFETINKNNNNSDNHTTKEIKPKSIKPKIMKKSYQISEIKDNQNTNNYVIDKQIKKSQEKTKSYSSNHQEPNDTYICGIKSNTPLKTKNELKSNHTLSTFPITPLLDRTNINVKNSFFSPLQSNNSIKSNMLKRDKSKIEKSISKKRKLGAIGKTLFDETPKALTNAKFLQNISPLKHGGKMTIQPLTTKEKQ